MAGAHFLDSEKLRAALMEPHWGSSARASGAHLTVCRVGARQVCKQVRRTRCGTVERGGSCEKLRAPGSRQNPSIAGRSEEDAARPCFPKRKEKLEIHIFM